MILLTSAAVLLAGCISNIALPEDGSPADNITDKPPSFSGSKITIEDINEGDFYPGDEAVATILLKNSGSSIAEDIIVELKSNGLIEIPEEEASMGIDKLMPGEAAYLKVPVKITGGIEEDLKGCIDSNAYADGAGLWRILDTRQ